MNPFFASLLGQQSSSIMGQDPNDLLEDEVTEGEPIVVDMPRQAPPLEPAPAEAPPPAPVGPVTSDAPPGMYDGMGLDNSEAMRQTYLINQQNEEMARRGDPERGIEPRKGMFGMKGTLRDVVGILGDAFLVQGGEKERYRPRRDQERFADAMAGFTRNPGAAVERAMATGIDNEAAYSIYDKEGARINDANRTDVNAQESFRKALDTARKEVSQVFARASALGTPEAMEAAQRFAMNTAQAYNMSPEQLMTSTNMTPVEQEVLAGRSATSNQNLNLPYTERRVEVAERNATSREQSIGIMAKRLGLDERKFREAINNRSFDEMMDMFGLNQDVINEQGRNRRDANNANNRSSSSEESSGGWDIKPVGR